MYGWYGILLHKACFTFILFDWHCGWFKTTKQKQKRVEVKQEKLGKSWIVGTAFCCINPASPSSLPNDTVVGLRLLFSLKPKEMAKMRLLAIWID